VWRKALPAYSKGLEGYRTAGVSIGVARWLGVLAELYGQHGRVAEGRALLPEAFATMRSGQRNIEAELYRIQGEILAQAGGRESEAEASLCQALTVARQQQARSLELRAAISLHRLWQRQGGPDAARHLLGGVYAWFTEGFDTTDVQAARALLDMGG
jgi:predicted ATPase